MITLLARLLVLGFVAFMLFNGLLVVALCEDTTN
jgi:hypothetical protein